MKFSIVIPTLNEQETIAQCLNAIQQGTELADEILVVDGLSTDNTCQIADAMDVKVLVNSKRHAAGGRNMGIHHAIGDVIVFTDADCVPSADWLAKIKAAFRLDPSLDGVGGPMAAQPPQTRVEAFWGRVFLEEILSFPKESCFVTGRALRGSFVTANCAYKKELLVRLDGFSDWFANNAEDTDLFWRAVTTNAKLLYLADVIVMHFFPRTVAEMIKKNIRNGISSSKLHRRYGKGPRVDKYLYRILLLHIWGIVTRKPDADLYCAQVLAHLLGKYYGSIRVGVINI